MSTVAVLRARFPRTVANLRQYGRCGGPWIDEAGQLHLVAGARKRTKTSLCLVVTAMIC